MQPPMDDMRKLPEIVHQDLHNLFGINDSGGINLFFTLQRVAHLSRLLERKYDDEGDLSGPRWRLLMFLYMHERLGRAHGITPTMLSKTQHVSKNTISALLRGLEAQGLIERRLDTDDLRAFHIQLTDPGREYISSHAPDRLRHLNEFASGLDLQEQEQFKGLLEKLQLSLIEQVKPDCHDTESIAAAPPRTADIKE